MSETPNDISLLIISTRSMGARQINDNRKKEQYYQLIWKPTLSNVLVKATTKWVREENADEENGEMASTDTNEYCMRMILNTILFTIILLHSGNADAAVIHRYCVIYIRFSLREMMPKSTARDKEFGMSMTIHSTFHNAQYQKSPRKKPQLGHGCPTEP